MRRISLLILFITISFSAMGVFAFPVQTLAAEPAKPAEKACRCYCASKGDGAVDSGMLNATKCTEQCAKKKQAVAVCASEFGDYPSSNLLCFTDKQCKLQKGVLDKTQQPECLKGEKWCYPDPAQQAKVKLQLSIAGMTEVSNLGDYLNSFYKWMLNSGIIIAIIFVMIGGLQYVLAAGGGDVSKAKTRIKNAVIGLALLIFSYLILFTVNPYLVRLQIPQLPMVRKVSLGDNKSCEAMKSEYNLVDKEGKDITGSTLAGKKCGDSALVKDKKDGGSVAAGITCNFDKCDKPGEACLGTGKNAKCLECQYAYKSKEKISENSCSSLSLKESTVAGKPYFQRCGWTKDLYVGITGIKDLINLTSDGQCGAVQIKCSNISKCADYGSVQVLSGKNKLGIQLDTDLKNISAEGNISLRSVCEENPCKIVSPGLESRSQTEQCRLGQEPSIWKGTADFVFQSASCDPAGTIEVKTGPKQTKEGSCDPKTCLAPNKCETFTNPAGDKIITACVSCDDLKGLQATPGLCMDLKYINTECRFVEKTLGADICMKIDCTADDVEPNCKSYTMKGVGDLCEENPCEWNMFNEGCEKDTGMCVNKTP